MEVLPVMMLDNPANFRAYTKVMIKGSPKSTWLGDACEQLMQTSQLHLLQVKKENDGRYEPKIAYKFFK